MSLIGSEWHFLNKLFLIKTPDNDFKKEGLSSQRETITWRNSVGYDNYEPVYHLSSLTYLSLIKENSYHMVNLLFGYKVLKKALKAELTPNHVLQWKQWRICDP